MSPEVGARKQRELEQEREDLLAFTDTLEQFCHYAYPIWRWGDGDGGSVFDHIKDVMHDLYPDTIPAELPPVRSYVRRPIRATLRTEVLERDEYRCQECGTHKGLTLDHIHPVSKGGEDTLENLRVLCRSCNSRKGARV